MTELTVVTMFLGFIIGLLWTIATCLHRIERHFKEHTPSTSQQES